MGVVYRTKKLPINGPVFEEYPDNALEFVGNNNLVQTVLALEHVFDDTKIFKKSKQSLRQLGETNEFSCYVLLIISLQFLMQVNQELTFGH